MLLLSSSVLASSVPPGAHQARAFPVPPIRARAAVVLNANTGVVIAAKNPHLRLPMASTTKIMTALLALQHGSLSDRITVPAAAFDFEGDATVM
ncbi:MAG: D-alanyl-D-alanine carboxypeptidase, partial [Chloroflexi bacterium]|nr:D-alanyl-D-alanine carboxypeptidase [Chloroflexota bacterium]